MLSAAKHLPVRPCAEFILSERLRSFASLGMTESEGLRVTSECANLARSDGGRTDEQEQNKQGGLLTECAPWGEGTGVCPLS